MTNRDNESAKIADERAKRPLARPGRDENGKAIATPEMLALAEALAHPEGDSYENARKLGFYCEQCG